MGSSSNSRLSHSYILINNSSAKYSLVLISNVKHNSNQVPSSKSQQVMPVRYSRQSMSLFVINSSTAYMCPIVHTQNLVIPTMIPSSSSSSLELSLALVVVVPCPEAMAPYISRCFQNHSPGMCPPASPLHLPRCRRRRRVPSTPLPHYCPLPSYESSRSCHPNVQRRRFLSPCIESFIDPNISSPAPLSLLDIFPLPSFSPYLDI